MAKKDIIVFDFETGGRDPEKCQVTQIAAIALDGRNFKCKAEFNSEIRPLYFDDDEAIANGWSPIEEGALKVTKKTREGLAEAPTLDVVWPKFVSFINKYNWNKTDWFAPIPAGYNIINFDMPIIKRLCSIYGPWNEKKGQQKLFDPIKKIDVMDMYYLWAENDPTIKSYSMDNLRKRVSLGLDNAHDALQDVKDTANVMIKFMNAHRQVYKKMSIDNCFADGGLYIE